MVPIFFLMLTIHNLLNVWKLKIKLITLNEEKECKDVFSILSIPKNTEFLVITLNCVFEIVPACGINSVIK
jgi:hypothetical protein